MRLRSVPGLLLLGLILLLALPSIATFYTDWLWFEELGYEQVFFRKLNAQAIIFAATFVVVFIALMINLRLAQRTLNRPHIVLGTGVDGRMIALEGRRLATLATGAAVVIAGLLAFAAANSWLGWPSFFHGTSFRQPEPLLGPHASSANTETCPAR